MPNWYFSSYSFECTNKENCVFMIFYMIVLKIVLRTNLISKIVFTLSSVFLSWWPFIGKIFGFSSGLANQIKVVCFSSYFWPFLWKQKYFRVFSAFWQTKINVFHHFWPYDNKVLTKVLDTVKLCNNTLTTYIKQKQINTWIDFSRHSLMELL